MAARFGPDLDSSLRFSNLSLYNEATIDESMLGGSMLIDDSLEMWKSNDSDELYPMHDEVDDVLFAIHIQRSL